VKLGMAADHRSHLPVHFSSFDCALPCARGARATTLGRWALLLLGVWTLTLDGTAAEEHRVQFEPTLREWRVEQQPGGTVRVIDGALVIDDEAGCTVWWREKITAPVEISYDVTVVARGGPHDRVSDVNCFWMASDPPAGTEPTRRSGRFEDYDTLRTYYVGFGGNDNTTTRFRRYAGDGAKPLLPEYDRREKKLLLEPNRTYHVRLVARDGVAEFWRDGEKIFSFRDPAPLTVGWFALRTVKSHLEIRNLRFARP
jgi:hypothetical protein